MRFGKGRSAELDGAFIQCTNCKKTLFRREFEENLLVCPHCNHHHRLSWRQRVEFTYDEGSFVESDTDLVSGDPLNFPEYGPKLAAAVAKVGMNDSVVSGRALIEGVPVSTAIADFHFMGGSMGSVNGEKITRTLERAANEGTAAILFCASGGARMQEGLLSLMQMAKTTAAVGRCQEARVPTIAVFTDPTMAGVLASYASVTDIILAETKALVGFAGARVSAQAGVSKVPDDFQKAEFVAKCGMIDKVVERRMMRQTLSTLVKLLSARSA
jgi:acetyl-CoA carboxylase carboxyl transferase subunit beta